MKPLWNYKDIFDLEYFLHKDAALPAGSLVQRDRGIYLRHIEPALAAAGQSPEPRIILRQWLEYRSRTEFGATDILSPGALFTEAHRTLRLLCLVIGLFFGSIAGLTFFNYAGTTPVNILAFLFFFIFSQIAVLLILLLSWLIRCLLRGRTASLPLGMRIMGNLTTKAILWGHRNILGRMWAESRDSLAASLGLLKGARRVYGSLFFWPVFILTQLLAIGANAGILAATLFRILTSDIAFGWQSTVQFSAPALHRLITVIAVPWSRFFPEDIASPSLTAIEGSRIILKDGIAHLATQDLVAWWPFLVLCLLVYGLLPRLFLYLASLFMQRRCLANLTFAHPPAAGLLQRMLTPSLTTQAAPEFRTQTTGPEPAPVDATAEAVRRPGGNPVLVLIPDDIFPVFEMQELHEFLAQRGFSHAGTIRFMEDYEADREVLEALREENWQGNCGILVLMESWMPPLVAFLSYLQEIRQIVGAETPIFIELLGRPAASPGLAPVPEGDWLVWSRKITALGDPYISLNPLREQRP